MAAMINMQPLAKSLLLLPVLFFLLAILITSSFTAAVATEFAPAAVYYSVKFGNPQFLTTILFKMRVEQQLTVVYNEDNERGTTDGR